MTILRLIIRTAVTLVAILVAVPVLVIGASDLGLDPRHWSGTRLSGVDLSALSLRHCSGGTVGSGGKYSQADLEAVEERVFHEHLDAVFEGSVDRCHDRIEVDAARLDHATLAALGKYGDAVAVHLDPYISGRPGFAAADLTSGREVAKEAAGPYRILPYWLSHEDPVGTWFTLLTGFPLYLGAVIAVLAAWWVLAVRRHLRRRRRSVTSEVPVEAS